MNGLVDSLYNVYTNKKTTKKLWESLDRKYKTKDVVAKKFIVDRFLDFKIMDSKTVASQVQELQVAAIIEKLPLAWKDFENYLKYK